MNARRRPPPPAPPPPPDPPPDPPPAASEAGVAASPREAPALWRVLGVALADDAQARAAAWSAAAAGRVELDTCADLDAAVHRLGGAPPLDAVLLGLPAARASALAGWGGLSQAVHAAAVLLLVDEGAESVPVAQALRLTRLGVQDLIGRDEPDARIGRRLRLAIERDRQARHGRRAQSTDPATGLPTRQQLVDHMHHLIALREREPAPMGLLVLRIEGLLTTEATLGAEGAALLRRKLAVRLRGSLRASDVVASLGADIFGVLLSAIDRPEHVEQVSAKLQAALRRPFSVGGQAQSVAVSVGLSLYPAHGVDAESLLRDALAAAAGRPVVGRVGLSNWQERGGVSPPAANDE